MTIFVRCPCCTHAGRVAPVHIRPKNDTKPILPLRNCSSKLVFNIVPQGQCRCGGVSFRLKPPTAFTGNCPTRKLLPRAPLLSVPTERFRLKRGPELLEEGGPWQLCGRCGTTLFHRTEDRVWALASTIIWPALNVDALHKAAEWGNSWDIPKLIHRGLPVEGELDGWTPLMYAASQGKWRSCRSLLQHGAQVDKALSQAVYSRTPETGAVLQLLLAHGANRQRLFQFTVWGGTVNDARRVHNDLIDVNLPDEMGRSPLYLAARNCSSMVSFLLRLGADLRLIGEDQPNPLGTCAFAGRLGVLRVLLKADPPQVLLDDALVDACRSGRIRCARILIEAGANLNPEGYTPLMAASRHGSLALVDLLLTNKADPSLRDSEGNSAADAARPFVGDLLQLTTPQNKGNVRYRWTTNSEGEPLLKLRFRRVTRRWVPHHASILERLNSHA